MPAVVVTNHAREPKRPSDGQPAPDEESAHAARPRTDKPTVETVAEDAQNRAHAPAVPKAAVEHSSIPGRPDPAGVATRLGGGIALPSSVATRFSHSYGTPLGDVRVHPDSPVPGAYGARALAVGRQIAFAPGRYDPETPEGQTLIGHELAHVAQQADGVQAFGLDDGPLEQEADAAAETAVAGGVFRIRAAGRGEGFRSVQFDKPDDKDRKPLEYDPNGALDTVWVADWNDDEGEERQRVAGIIYGGTGQAETLEHVSTTTKHGFKFDYRFLEPSWRSRFEEERARLQRTKVKFGTFKIPGLKPTLSNQVATVVVYMPTAGDALSVKSPTFDLSTAPVLPTNVPFNFKFNLDPNTADAYDPTIDYGKPVGKLSEIVDRPRGYSSLLERFGDERVVVELDEANSWTTRLASPRMSKLEEQDPFPFGGPAAQSPESMLFPQLNQNQIVWPARRRKQKPAIPIDDVFADPTGGGGPPDTSRLRVALGRKALPGVIDLGIKDGTKASPGPAYDGTLIVLDPTGADGTSTQGVGPDEVTVISGKDARAYLAQGGAPYVWSGGDDVTTFGRIVPSTNPPTLDLGVQWPTTTSFDQQANQLLGINQPTTWLVPPPKVTALRVLTISELRELVRRGQTAKMLKRVGGVDGSRLKNVAAMSTHVFAVEGDTEDIVKTGYTAVAPLDVEATFKPPAALEEGAIDGALDRIDLSLALLSGVRDGLPAHVELLVSLQARLQSFSRQLKLEADKSTPDVAKVAQIRRMIDVQVEIMMEASAGLKAIPELRTKTKEYPELQNELDDIEAHYALALAFSDQTASANALFTQARMRMRRFPLLVVRVRGKTATKDTKDVLQHTGDDSFWMGELVVPTRDKMRETSKANAAEDWESLDKLLKEIQRLQDSTDPEERKRAPELLKQAGEIEARMEGRFSILANLSQALVAFQQMGHSGIKYFQVTTNTDERLEELVGELTTHLEAWEAAKDNAARKALAEEVEKTLKKERYKNLYEDVASAMKYGDMAAGIVITVLAALATWGVGALVGGAVGGVIGTASTAYRVLAFGGEVVAFTLADRALMEVLIDPTGANKGLVGFGTPEHASLFEEMLTNAAMLGMLKGIGRLWGSLGIKGAKGVAGELLVIAGAMQGAGMVQQWFKTGQPMSLNQFGEMGATNAAVMILMHAAGMVTRKLFLNIEKSVAGKFGNHARVMEILEIKHREAGERLREIVEAVDKKKKPLDEAALARTYAELGELQIKAAEVRKAMEADPKVQEALKDPAKKAEWDARAVELGNRLDAIKTQIQSNKLGIELSADGSGAVFGKGNAAQVSSFYTEKGYSVREVSRTPDGRVQLEATRTTEGGASEKILLLEGRAGHGVRMSKGFEAGSSWTVPPLGPSSASPDLAPGQAICEITRTPDGLVARVEVKHHVDMRPEDVKVHEQAAEILRGWGGLQGKVRRIVQRLRGVKDPPFHLTAEVWKLEESIRIRMVELEAPDVAKGRQAQAKAEIDLLEEQRARVEAALDDPALAAKLPRNRIYADVGGPRAQQLKLPEPPTGHEWKLAANGSAVLEPLPGYKGQRLTAEYTHTTLDPATGKVTGWDAPGGRGERTGRYTNTEALTGSGVVGKKLDAGTTAELRRMGYEVDGTTINAKVDPTVYREPLKVGGDGVIQVDARVAAAEHPSARSIGGVPGQPKVRMDMPPEMIAKTLGLPAPPEGGTWKLSGEKLPTLYVESGTGPIKTYQAWDPIRGVFVEVAPRGYVKTKNAQGADVTYSASPSTINLEAVGLGYPSLKDKPGYQYDRTDNGSIFVRRTTKGKKTPGVEPLELQPHPDIPGAFILDKPAKGRVVESVSKDASTALADVKGKGDLQSADSAAKTDARMQELIAKRDKALEERNKAAEGLPERPARGKRPAELTEADKKALEAWRENPRVKEWKEKAQAVIEASEKIGEKAADVWVEKAFPGAKPLDPGGTGAGVFDRIWEWTDGSGRTIYIVVEAKGGGSPLKTRKIGQENYQQGTGRYFKDIADNMKNKTLGEQLADALEGGRVVYMHMQAKVSTVGPAVEGGAPVSAYSGVEMRRFDTGQTKIRKD